MGLYEVPLSVSLLGIGIKNQQVNAGKSKVMVGSSGGKNDDCKLWKVALWERSTAKLCSVHSM